jgi:hypothetical protein
MEEKDRKRLVRLRKYLEGKMSDATENADSSDNPIDRHTYNEIIDTYQTILKRLYRSFPESRVTQREQRFRDREYKESKSRLIKAIFPEGLPNKD